MERADTVPSNSGINARSLPYQIIHDIFGSAHGVRLRSGLAPRRAEQAQSDSPDVHAHARLVRHETAEQPGEGQLVPAHGVRAHRGDPEQYEQHGQHGNEPAAAEQEQHDCDRQDSQEHHP